MQATDHTIEAALWRQAMGGFPSGVTIVTTHDRDGGPAGTAVNAFCAVSLDPPLLLACLDRNSRTLDLMRRTGTFCVNILSDRHEDIVRRFASKTADRFAGIGFTHRPSGDPVLDDCVAWFDCRVRDMFDGGDHEIVVGHVRDLHADPDAIPLAYHRGRVWPLSAEHALKDICA